MTEFRGKTAVITGAASGIGYALAKACADRGMRLVLADVEEKALRESSSILSDGGAELIALRTDVSIEADMNRLADEAVRRFGAVHMLFSNAGVGAGSLIWNSTMRDWQWTLGVNLWGAIHAVNAFVPRMLAQDCECRVVFTSSCAGIENGPFNGIYRVSKHALVAFSETLYHELKMIGSKVGVSVLCPGETKTRICDADRNRPERFRNTAGDEYLDKGKPFIEYIRAAVENGVSAEFVAEYTFDAVVKDRFYILPDQKTKPIVERRAKNIVAESNPVFEVPSRR